jgi:hypothetical protein
MANVYCVQSGLGKTYFCQHHVGFIDLDAGVFCEQALYHTVYLNFLDFCIHTGYTVITSAEL